MWAGKCLQSSPNTSSYVHKITRTNTSISLVSSVDPHCMLCSCSPSSKAIPLVHAAQAGPKLQYPEPRASNGERSQNEEIK
ncbi:hypothetical protein RIF29_29112 [Crotalaria pallida]|uniref:Uncharacterized protein n=1 Tax=Crotalaria pallida TaxID=3830 RepID=A0AAN9EKN8_CROPI